MTIIHSVQQWLLFISSTVTIDHSVPQWSLHVNQHKSDHNRLNHFLLVSVGKWFSNVACSSGCRHVCMGQVCLTYNIDGLIDIITHNAK